MSTLRQFADWHTYLAGAYWAAMVVTFVPGPWNGRPRRRVDNLVAMELTRRRS